MIHDTPYNDHPRARQFHMGAAAARLFLADDESYRVLVRQPVKNDSELIAFTQGWESVTRAA